MKTHRGIRQKALHTGWLGLSLVMGVWGAGLCRALEPEQAGQASVDQPSFFSESNSTVITSTRLSFDQQTRMAIFRDHVVVTDPHVKITSDRLTILFSEENKVTTIEAEGNVVIQQGEKQATGQKARYEIGEGKFVLSGGHPIVQNGRDMLSADTVTFWRNSNRILCEPNARLIVRSERDIFTEGFMKE